MNRYIIGSVAALAALLMLAACHHEPESDDKESLDGSPSFSVPAYLRPGDVVDVDVTGVSHPKGEGLGIIWVETVSNAIDTVRTPSDPSSVSTRYTFTIPDTTGTFVVRCSAYADGYYTSTSSVNFTVVKTGLDESLSGREIVASDPLIADERDGSGPKGENVYYYATANGLDWMRNNLAYTGSGIPFRESEAMSYIFGRYYTWNEAQTACPEGWRLPTDAEWTALASALTGRKYGELEPWNGAAGALMVNAYFNGTKMWEFWPEVKVTNASDLSIIPAGYAIRADENKNFYGVFNYAVFWTADAAESDLAYYRYIYVKQPDVYLGVADRESFSASVRCVREAE